jgi:hypothetical protein
MSETRRLPEIKPVERRTFLRYSLIGSTAAGLAGVRRWRPRVPVAQPGRRASVRHHLGNAEDILAEIRSERAPLRQPRRPHVRRRVGPEPARRRGGLRRPRDPVGSTGLMALYTEVRAPGLPGAVVPVVAVVRVPVPRLEVQQVGRVGRRSGPRGLDRFPSEVDGDGNLQVVHRQHHHRPARTARVLQQEPEGPNCVDL